MKITVKQQVDVKFIRAACHVRYWEDAIVNGISDDDGKLIPCRIGEGWCPLITLDTGIIQNWPKGTTASIHYKVCDAGTYDLLDESMEIRKRVEGYVPSIMCPEDNG